MWLLLMVNLLLWCRVVPSVAVKDSDGDEDFGAGLIAAMKDDTNLDLPDDEEYEDLRAELLAYHTAFAKIASVSSGRRSLMITPCWKIGGICINFKLCNGFRYLTEVRGCRDRLNVCCFTTNNIKVRNYRDQGIAGLIFPWQSLTVYGNGKGIIPKYEGTKPKNITSEKNEDFIMTNDKPDKPELQYEDVQDVTNLKHEKTKRPPKPLKRNKKPEQKDTSLKQKSKKSQIVSAPQGHIHNEPHLSLEIVVPKHEEEEKRDDKPEKED